ncbi:MAG: CPBP family intramembrane metalloprotease [Eubacterium sp.]|nr:CPBP family intramembrane metalloprotease [Eubacterium sp.]
MNKVSNKRIIGILFRKEIKDVLRDRKSVLMMFLVPVIIYPLIFLLSFFIMSMMQTGAGVQTYDIVLDGMPDDMLVRSIDDIQKEDNKKKTSYKISYFDTDDFKMINHLRDVTSDGSDVSAEAYDPDSTSKDAVMEDIDMRSEAVGKELYDMIKASLEEESIDAYLSYIDGSYKLFYNSSITNSSNAAGIIGKAVSDVKQELVEESLESEGLDPSEILNPIELDSQDTATSEQSLGFFLGTIIPFMLVMSLVSGVFSPAMDATTGEKERGTLETLLMMPVTGTQIIIAKFFAVALVGIVTTILSVVSMAGLGAYVLSMAESAVGVNFGNISVGTFVPAILISLPALVVLSLFLTSICMCVTCFAKSNKEASTYLSPIMIAVMLTGYLGFIPNIELDTTMSMIPVANVCLLIKNLLLFKASAQTVMIVILSTAVYTGLIIMILGRMYRTEAVLFDEGKNALALLERRSNMKPGGVPSSGDGWFIAMVGFLLLMVVGGLLQAKLGLNGVAWTQVLIIALPVAMAVYTKKDIKKTFSIRFPSVRGWIGGLVFGIGIISFGQAVTSVVYSLFPQEGEVVTDALMNVLDGPAPWLWIVVAVMPAICEEGLFRGYLMSAFMSRFKPCISILFVAVIFGIYHTSLVRFPATALLGGAFAFILYKTGSILPGAILHCLNNSIAVCIIVFPEWMQAHVPFLMTDVQATEVVLVEVGIGAVLMAIGTVILRKRNRDVELAR